MSCRSNITRRFIAVCGVWLTLLSCMQQTHAFCVFNGCLGSKEQQITGDCGDKCTSGKKCSHSRCCASRDSSCVKSAQVDAECQPAEPCDQTCWCCQAPAPQMGSAPLDTESVTQLTVTCAGSCHAASWLEMASAGWSMTIINESSPQRAIDVCVRLCRFLA